MRQIFLPLVSLAVLAACAGSASEASTQPPAPGADTAAAPADTAPADTATLTFAFAGDMMLGTTFPDSLTDTHLPADRGRRLFEHVGEITRRVDIAGANLEGSFLEGPGRRRRMTNPNTYFIFRMPPDFVDRFDEAGFDVLGIANNHINDFGQPGRSSTMATIRGAGLSVVGLKDSCETAVFERKGLKIGVTLFGHGDNNLDVTDLDELRRVVQDLHGQCDIVVVSFHGGAEGGSLTHVPFKPEIYVGEQRGNVAEFARAAVDAGADLVFGHGPHVPRGAELYRDRLIMYSLGNFCTPYRISVAGNCGLAPLPEVRIARDGSFIEGRIHSFVQVRGRGPQPDSTHRAAALIGRMSLADFPESPLSITSDGLLLRK